MSSMEQHKNNETSDSLPKLEASLKQGRYDMSQAEF